MKHPIRSLFIVAIFAGISNSAHAYLDPGTGSILLQGLIAAVAAALATGKYWWFRVKRIFVKTTDNDNDEVNPEVD